MSWLVSRTNIILRECQMDSGSWALLTDASWIAAWKAACRTARNAAGDAGGDAAGHAAGTAAWYTDWYAARNAAMDATVDVARTSAWYAARDATRGAARDTTIEQIHALGTTIGQIHALGIKDSQSIGKKCYQIAECKSLLAINRDLCFAVMAIVKEHNLPKSIQIPKEKLLGLKDNPWIQQYVELYQ